MKFLAFLFLISTHVVMAASSLKVTTYNLGLAHTFVPLAEERTAPLISTLKSYDSDILCLQEVWRKSDQKKLAKELKAKFPHSYTTKIKNYRSGPRPTCRIKEIFGEGKFVSCMQNQCGDVSGDDFTDCIIDKCNTALEDLKASNRNCASALMAQVGKSPIASIATLLNPLWRAGLFAYEGSNGLMLLSRLPLSNKKYLDMKEISTLNRRGALQARVNVDGKNIEVMCTHLSADLTTTAPYTGPYETWGDENAAQMERLLMASDHSVLPAILMGDFNCGAEDVLMGIAAELPNSCTLPRTFGFTDPLATSARECTFCVDNLLNEGEEKSTAIDHIYLRGLKPLSDRVLFKERIKVFTKKGTVETQLSDHYGYEVEIETP